MTVSEAGRCTNADCRWDEHAEEETQEHLPRHYVLLDRYYMGRVLGQGGFGVTYIAHDLKLDRTVAIKEFFPKDQCSRGVDRVTVRSSNREKGEQFRFGLERFLTEAQNIARLGGHPNIVSITDYAEANGTAYMVMEFIPGLTLKQYLANQGGKIPYAVASEIMLHVMSGLNKAHEYGLIHRDVSPDNIMLSAQGPVKLIDFGAARQAIGEKSQNLTTILKPGYAPEEQYRLKGEQGAWTDVYATAATLYRCITGKVPPPATDRMREDELAPPGRLCDSLPPLAESGIVQGLSIYAAGRPQTIHEFRQFFVGQTPPPPPPPPDKTTDTAIAERPMFSRASLVCFLVAFVAYGASFMLPGVADGNGKTFPGWYCALESIVLGWQDTIQLNTWELRPVVSAISLLYAGLINPLFLLSLVLFLLKRTRKLSEKFAGSAMCFQICCWVAFYVYQLHPHVGYYLWTLAMLVASFAGPCRSWLKT